MMMKHGELLRDVNNVIMDSSNINFILTIYSIYRICHNQPGNVLTSMDLSNLACLFEYEHDYRRNRPFSYITKEPGSSVIFIHFYTRGSIEWR